MSYKIALASTDGKVINQHFGRSEQFHIIEIDEINDKYRYVETRHVSACCNKYGHETDSFEVVARVLRDAQAIIVSKIGSEASDYMENKGFVVYEAPYLIDVVIEKIMSEKLYITDNWQFDEGRDANG